MILEIELTVRGWSNEFEEGVIDSLFFSEDGSMSIEFLDDGNYEIHIYSESVDDNGHLSEFSSLMIIKNNDFTIQELEQLYELLEDTA